MQQLPWKEFLLQMQGMRAKNILQQIWYGMAKKYAWKTPWILAYLEIEFS